MSENTENDQAEGDPWAEAMSEQEDSSVPTASVPAQPAEPAKPDDSAELEVFGPNGATGLDSDVNMEVILDVPLTLSMEVGRCKISIRNLLQLNHGSVVELDRMAGEHLDVLVNGTLIAHGEVVLINDKFGIRLTDVVSPVQRIQNLRK